MIKTWAALTSENIVFDIVNFSLSEPSPYMNIQYVCIGPESPYSFPDIGDVWTGDGFIKP